MTHNANFTLPLPNGDFVEFLVADQCNFCCESPVDFLEGIQLVGEQFVADVTEAILRRDAAMQDLVNQAQEAGLDSTFWNATVDMVASEADEAIAEVERNVR